MPTLEEIRHQINSLPHKYIFYTKKEINHLPDIMVEGEYVRALVSGYSEKRTVLAVCTNRRILILDKGMFFGLRQWQIALDRVQSIDGEYVLFFGSIRIWDGASSINMNMVLAKNIDPFIKEVRQAIDDFKRLSFSEVTGRAQAAAQQHSAPLDVASQLERLAALKDAGHLSEEEFQSQKYKLLAQS
jgi:Bacterial PH domain/Short C-terminal domain